MNRPAPHAKESVIARAAERSLHSLIYYTALFTCCIIALGVSFFAILYFARANWPPTSANPDAVAEARELREFAQELHRLTYVDKDDRSRLQEHHIRQVNDARRRMQRYPRNSEALNALINAGDRLLTAATRPDDLVAHERAVEALETARTAVRERIRSLGVEAVVY